MKRVQVKQGEIPPPEAEKAAKPPESRAYPGVLIPFITGNSYRMSWLSFIVIIPPSRLFKLVDKQLYIYASSIDNIQAHSGFSPCILLHSPLF
jgi:hypothetical protein